MRLRPSDVVSHADSDKSNARLIGIEYIISRRLFEGLPADEKKYWHSHSHEVGGLFLLTVPICFFLCAS